MKAKSWREWEKPVIELDDALAKLRQLAAAGTPERKAEIERKIRDFEKRRDRYIATTYKNLGPWENVLVARADTRPYTLDYVNVIFDDFVELQGDRRAGADHAIVSGPARLDGRPVMVLGHQKGRTIQERQHRNFAMAKPEGYRKAVRMMELAERFNMPVVSFLDTPAADPGVESESRGISEAIAASILKMFELTVPTVSIVIGEGGSGGAIGIGIGNVVMMQEHAIYSVIPPEGCAAILWRQPEMGAEAAQALQLTATSALELGLIDEVLPEPFGGAHRSPAEAAEIVGQAVRRAIASLTGYSRTELKEQRYRKFRSMGRVADSSLARAVTQER